MKSRLNIIILMGAALAAAALFMASPAKAQSQANSFAQMASWGGITNGNQSATNLNFVIDVSKQASVGVQLTVNFDTAGSTNTATFYFTRSIDAVTYDSIGQVVALSPAGAAGRNVTVVTNLPSYGANYIKLNYLTNASTSANITNIAGGYGGKIQFP